LHSPDAQDKSHYDCHAMFLTSPTCLTSIINKENSELLPTFHNLLKVCTGSSTNASRKFPMMCVQQGTNTQPGRADALYEN